MTGLEVHLVREFFELHYFKVTTHWQQEDEVHPRIDGGAQLFVENARYVPGDQAEVLLRPEDIAHVDRAVVDIRAWHSDRFYSHLIDTKPVITQFAEPGALGPSRDFFGPNPFKTLLVVSEFPQSPTKLAEALARLEKSPVDLVMEFPAILYSLVQRVSVHGAYPGSQTLQMLQVLKRYRMLRNQQMELGLLRDVLKAD